MSNGTDEPVPGGRGQPAADPWWDGPTSPEPDPATAEADPDSSLGTFSSPLSPEPGSYVAPPPRRARHRVPLIVGVATLAVAGVAIGVAATGGSSPKSPEAVVMASVNRTLSDHTAHVATTLTETVGSATVRGTGSGSVDFTNGSEDVDIEMAIAGHSLRVETRYIQGTVYEAIPQLSTLEPGKSWLSIDLSSAIAAVEGSTGSLGAGGNPAGMLALYAQQGATVTPVGQTVIAGRQVHGYNVTFDPSILDSPKVQAALPSWMRQDLAHVNLSDIAAVLYVDGSGRLVRLAQHLNAAAAGQTAYVAETTDYSDYGTAVDISAPPASQVVTFDQFLKDTQAASSNSTS